MAASFESVFRRMDEAKVKGENVVEAAGIEPASASALPKVSTCLSQSFI